MAAISGFTVTLVKRRKVDALPSVYEHQLKLEFGNGSDTYPTGGIPLDKQDLGLPNDLESLEMIDMGSADGYLYKFDKANSKIKLFIEGDAAGELVEESNSATPQGELYVLVKGY